MKPQIIKLASGSAYYANYDLIKAIKQVINQESGKIKPEDNIYFFKDVTFQRGLLHVAQDRFSRVIKMEKANAIVVNNNLTFPSNGIGLKNGKLDNNCPPGEADDILFNISSMGGDYLSVIQQWWQYLQLTHKPEVVFESSLIEFVNSGIVINEDNYSALQDLVKSDINIAAQTIATCNLKESFLYVLTLLYFEQGYLNKNSNLMNRFSQTVIQYFSSRSCTSTIPENILIEMLHVPFIQDRITASLLTQVGSVVGNLLSKNKLIENVNIDFKWKI
jgi:hypothetical protein